ncbi:type II CAAX endopeptidase family protein [Cytobacillus sp. FSL W7-1323]|uniref:CPBP family intramembrane glutamic endopeptidase n=1 Tax=Cytobacillus TaxID=2675230 RepID=UPI0027823121|nr:MULTISPECIES: type II CAAX endopeptidase family protein [Cytobacillus]MDQ0185027.1 membrane protease YdiL (CAAX protease family) [Cytobacillus kochii]MEA1851761.1 type II CAAX endopeptidase family protein [Cytobacillus sp. OWB-43]
MRKNSPDIRLIVGIVLAHVLMYFTFEDKSIFWYIFSATMLFLISFAIISIELDHQETFTQNLLWGTLSGVFLYGIFWLGYTGLSFIGLSITEPVAKLYSYYGAKNIWQYLLLIVLFAPGEEIFWRGFVQKRVMNYTNGFLAVGISSILFASVQFYSGSWALVLAALIAGLYWGTIYLWKRSIVLLITSHIIFSLLLFVFFPLV